MVDSGKQIGPPERLTFGLGELPPVRPTVPLGMPMARGAIRA